MICYVGARSVQLGLCEWARRLLVAGSVEMPADSRAALDAEILQVAHLLWSVSSVVNRPLKWNVFA